MRAPTSPTDVEVAAVVAALAVLAAERRSSPPPPRSAWSDPGRAVRRPARGPWRLSLR